MAVAPLRIGVLGAADVAYRRMAPAFREAEGLVLTAVASRQQERAEAFAAEFGCAAVAGYEGVLRRDDVDAVYIPAPVALIAELAGRALRSDKHVLAEKTVTTSSRIARELGRLARARGRALMANFAFLKHRRQQVVKELVASGELGEIRLFRGDFAFPPRRPEDIRYNPELGGGALLDAGVYPLRAAQWFLGADLTVEAALLTGPDPEGVDIAGAIQARSSRGIPAQLSFGFDHHYRCEYELWGSRGRLRVDRAYTQPTDLAMGVRLVKGASEVEVAVPADDQYVRVAERFVQAVRSPGVRDAEIAAVQDQADVLEAVIGVARRVTWR